jgi:protein gp37
MGQKSSIEWTDATWNPIRGCTRVSEGCRHCYAETVANRFSGPGLPYEGLTVLGKWNGTIKFVEEHLLDPLRWKAPRRIFVNSMSDLFHPGVTDAMLDKIFAVMALCPQHTFQILTKRPERMLEYFNRPDRSTFSKTVTNPCAWLVWVEATKIQACSKRLIPGPFKWTEFAEIDTVAPWPLRNVWLGVSVEDQKTADARIPLLLQAPAAVRFISYEPALGPLNLADVRSLEDKDWWFTALECGDIYWSDGDISDGPQHSALDWIICGGESGPGARPMQSEWAQLVRDQCIAAGVAFFFKQWGEWLGAMQDGVMNGGEVTLNCSDAPIRVGRKYAGNLLDGKVWQQFPGDDAKKSSRTEESQ